MLVVKKVHLIDVWSPLKFACVCLELITLVPMRQKCANAIQARKCKTRNST
jgi:hypothetical protein